MAQLDVQEKKTTSWWVWAMLLVGLLILGIFLYQRSQRNDARTTAEKSKTVAPTESYTTGTTATTSGAVAVNTDDNDDDAFRRREERRRNEERNRDEDRKWYEIDFNAPKLTFREIGQRGIVVRGREDYTIFSMDETILFDTDQSAIRENAAEELQQVAKSLNNRYKDRDIRVYGYTDSEGSEAYNLRLAAARANAVRDWLIRDGNIDAARITVHPVGEVKPLIDSDSEKAQARHRRVDIVATRE